MTSVLSPIKRYIYSAFTRKPPKLSTNPSTAFAEPRNPSDKMCNPSITTVDTSKPLCSLAAIPCCLHFVQTSDTGTQMDQSFLSPTETSCDYLSFTPLGLQTSYREAHYEEKRTSTSESYYTKITTEETFMERTFVHHTSSGVTSQTATQSSSQIAVYYPHMGIRMMNVSQFVVEVNVGAQFLDKPKRTKAAVFRRSLKTILKQKLRKIFSKKSRQPKHLEIVHGESFFEDF